MKNLFFYIHQTSLIDYYIKPICHFLSQNYKITILHLNKKNKRQNKQYTEFEMIDISDYGVVRIKKLFTQYAPAAIILPGFISIYELYILRLANTLQIPSIYIEHGIYSHETSHLPFKKLLSSKISYVLTRNIFFLRRYLDFAIKSNNPRKELFILYSALYKKDYSNTQFSHALFFAQYGYEHINRLFKYTSDKVSFMGYPLAYTNEEFKIYKQLANNVPPKSRKAIYIHQPFIKDKLTTWSYNDEKKMLIELAQKLKETGLTLEIALHPRESADLYKDLYKNTDIIINTSFNKQNYAYYDLAIGHYSTAIMYPLFFNKPIYIIDYGVIKSSLESPYAPINALDKDKTSNYSSFKTYFIGEGILSFENIASTIDKNLLLLNKVS